MNHPIQWLAPAMLRSDGDVLAAQGPRRERRRPTILRFGSDSFMEEFMALLNTEPQRLVEFRARRETWRGFQDPPAIEVPRQSFLRPFQRRLLARRGVKLPPPAAAPPPNTAPPPLKLYQPAHQRYYLVAASLVCEVPGLPERKVDAGRHETAGFVIRRYLGAPGETGNVAAPPSHWTEHAWVPAGNGGTWQPANPADKLAPGEDVLPLFALNYNEAGGRARRLLSGLIPVGKREAYLAGARGTARTADSSPAATGPSVSAATGTEKTARKILLRKEVIEPWKRLREQAAAALHNLKETPADTALTDAKIASLKDLRAPLQVSSWLILLDLARYLKTYLSPVWSVVVGSAASDSLTETEQGNLWQVLDLARLGPDTSASQLRNRLTDPANSSFAAGQLANSLAAALKKIGHAEAVGRSLEAALGEFKLKDPPAGFPDFLFPLADPEFPSQPPLPVAPEATSDELKDVLRLDDGNDADPLDKFAALIVRALPTRDPQAPPEPAIPAAAGAPAEALEGWFVIRCVYRRPECGKLHDEVVSEATETFQLAGFFDPDAPARPIRIGLPIDTTPAGLRKFDKNTLFVMSDTLCGQMKRMRGMTFGDLVRSVLPFPLHKDLDPGGGACAKGGASFGMMCSLSIPIITICALILLMIMVNLLDMIFRWLPYFMICFPVPKLDGKRAAQNLP